ncbi:hypothetical protein DZG01_02830 [Pseudomonas fluorescens]|nr:hypothetical protein DZG01_02830 [Pseudomonas fluorescens]
MAPMESPHGWFKKAEPPVSNDPIANSGASPGATATGFHYDALDTLIGRTTSAGREQRFYRNDELATEIQGAVSSSFVRAEGIVLAEHRSGAGIQSLLLAGNDKNSVLCEVSQEAIRGIAYSPYGHRVAGSPVNSHLGYNGERRETQSGWYLLGNGYRVFNPFLMRFHSPDNQSPFGKGGLNAYMYCVGDPINNVDPTGHGWFWNIFRRLGRTTAPSVSKEIPETLKKIPKDRSASLIPITEKHVADFKKGQLLAYNNAHNALTEMEFARMLEFQGRVDPVEVESMIERFQGFYADVKSATEKYTFYERNLGKRLITRGSARDIENKLLEGAPLGVKDIDIAVIEKRLNSGFKQINQRRESIRAGLRMGDRRSL